MQANQGKLEPADKDIKNMLLNGHTYEIIAKKLKVSPKRIANISKQLQNNEEVHSKKMGAPRKITPEIEQEIAKQTFENPEMSGDSVADKIKEVFGIGISGSSVNKTRNKLHFRYSQKRTKQYLTDTQIHNRINFCTEQLAGKINWSTDVIFSDESRFCATNDSHRVWVKNGVYNEGTFKSVKKYEAGIMVWGAIGLNWRSPLILVSGHLNSDGYIKMLEENNIFGSLDAKYGHRNFYFEQDGATCHTSKKTMNWIGQQDVNVIDHWPANSPDLTCIEQVWSILKQKVKDHKPANNQELFKALQYEWNIIPQYKLNELISKTPDRFQLCLQEEGKAIGPKLHTLNKENNIDQVMNFIRSPTESLLLNIPLFHKKSSDLCKGILDRLMNLPAFPDVFKVNSDDELPLGNEWIPQLEHMSYIIKNDIRIPDIIKKLDQNEYGSLDDCYFDILQMFNNVDLLMGRNASLSVDLRKYKNDIEFAWSTLSNEHDLPENLEESE